MGGGVSIVVFPHSKEDLLNFGYLENGHYVQNSSTLIKNIACNEDVTFKFDEPDEPDDDVEILEFAEKVYHFVSGFEILDNVLITDSGVDALLRFLRHEYSEENLQFYMDVKAARKGSVINVSDLNMRHLLDTYIIDKAPHEVIYLYVYIYKKCNKINCDQMKII